MITNSRGSLTGLGGLSWFVSKVSYNTKQNAGGFPLICNTTATGGNYTKYFSSALIGYQTDVLDLNNKVFAGVSTDVLGVNPSSTECVRASKQRIHFSGIGSGAEINSLGKLADEWYDAIKANYSAAEGVAPTKVLKLQSVSVSGSNYVLTVEPPLAGTNTYYWTKGTNGINDTISTTTTNTSPPISAAIGDRINCYVKDNTGKIYVAQPYIHSGSCKNCRTQGANIELSAYSLNFIGAGESKSITIGGSDLDWDLLSVPSWILTNWDDANQKLDFQASANTTGSNRNASINFVELGTNDVLRTLNITQAASTPSACTTVSLTGGAFSPTNPVSERSGNGIGMQLNKTVQGATLQVNGQQHANGIGVHSNSRIVYNINNNYSTFTGWVGRDDEQDACGCGTQRVRFQVKGNGELLWTSDLLDNTSPPQPFTINVAGKSTLELLMDDGGDNSWGDHGDWLKPELNCATGGPVCNVQQPAIPTASSTNVPSGTNVTLTTSCASGTPKWSNNGSGITTTVTPSVTTTYSVYCDNGVNCISSSRDITIIVTNSNACSPISSGTVLGTWSGYQLVARQFYGSMWLTQRVSINPDRFVVRGSEMLLRGDVALANQTFSSLVGCFAFQYSGIQGLLGPTAAQFPTPTGYSIVYAADGTPNFLQNSPSNPPAYNGYFDTANCSGISGWVWNSADPSMRPFVEILEGSTIVASGFANAFRADLLAAGIGDGNYTFTMTTPSSLKDGANRVLKARVQGSTYELNQSPKSINCTSMGARIGNFEAVSQEEKLEGMVVSPNPSEWYFQCLLFGQER